MLPVYFIFLWIMASATSFPEEMKNSALFVKELREFGKRSNDKFEKTTTSSAEEDMDKTVGNLLAWLQDRYTDNSRRARSQSVARNYLPTLIGTTTQRPRPFQQTVPTTTQYPIQGFQGENQHSYQEKDYQHSTAIQQGSQAPNTAPSYQAGIQENFPTQGPTFPAQNLPTQSQSFGPPSQNPGFELQGPTGSTEYSKGNALNADELNHPPHIHAINVQCGKEAMTINIEFNRQFDGVIYSKGYYQDPQCRYITANSGQSRYTFTVMLNSCGTQFIDQFSEGKQAYLENVLVLQSEPGIQEVWDTIRTVRCLWEGSINKALSVALSVGTLNQEIVTFSGDTATAVLDIQVGRGPYAPAANGLVKIGETMTLVVTVEGDPGFSVLVRQCVAKDGDPNSGNLVQLTDDQGCVLRPKLIGAFQTTTDTSRNAVIAYAFFQAFKFPDVMDLYIECNVELCKAQCYPCSDPNQKVDPGRRKKRWAVNSTSELPLTLVKKLMVYVPEDISPSLDLPGASVDVGKPYYLKDNVCLSMTVFYVHSSLLLGFLGVSVFTMAFFWLKVNHTKCRIK